MSPFSVAPIFIAALLCACSAPHDAADLIVRNGDVRTATVGGATEPTPAELARREKLTRESR